MRKFRIASRKSDLARIQAQSVARALSRLDSSYEVVLSHRESLGDRNQEDPLWKMPEKGVFTQDFRDDLLSEKIDMVVHSWKDLPTEMGPETRVLGALPRADQRDLLLIKKSVLATGKSSPLKILSSSPRRVYNLESALKNLLPKSIVGGDVTFADIRGNVPTRIRKTLEDLSADGMVLAKAGIDRLLSETSDEFWEMKRSLQTMLEDFRWMVLPLSVNPTAAAQGALALEIKSSRRDLESLLAPLICPKTTAQVHIERAILKSYGGGCHQKIGVSIIDHKYGGLISLKGKTDSGQTLDSFEILCDLVPRLGADFAKSVQGQMTVLGHLQGDVSGWAKSALFDSTQTEAAKSGLYFPKKKSDALKIFDRREIKMDFERLRYKPLMVARANALPAGYAPGADQVLWTAGVETWKSLAARGYWVSGTCDSLGECFDPEHLEKEISKSVRVSIDALAPGKVDQFVKLTHDRSKGGANTLFTYTLLTRTDVFLPKVTPKWFYWMSGSAFLWALEQNPSIINALHSCGPGNTLQTLLSQVPRSKVRLYPSYDIWLEQIHQVTKESS